MSVPPRLLGAVLAGGAGRRFGGPKADAPMGGTTLAHRALAALAGVVEDVVVLSSRPVSVPPGTTILPDACEDAGPLGGLAAALREAAARGLDGVFLLACDLPLVRAPLLRRIRDALEALPGVAPERPGGGVEAACAVYRVSVAPLAEKRLASEDRSLQALFREMGGVTLSLASLHARPDDFLNVNTPADGERARRALQGRGGPAR